MKKIALCLALMALLGLGAGHTPGEWDAIGQVRPGVRGRVDRCIAVAEATTRLLAGEKVTMDLTLVYRSPRITAATDTTIVSHSRSPMTSVTGMEAASDVPRSPVRIPPIQSTYCSIAGSFRPSCSLRFASASGVARSAAKGRASERAGAPGVFYLHGKPRRRSQLVPDLHTAPP